MRKDVVKVCSLFDLCVYKSGKTLFVCTVASNIDFLLYDAMQFESASLTYTNADHNLTNLKVSQISIGYLCTYFLSFIVPV